MFVLGVPKSGTTWLQQLLDAHPDIICTGEGALHRFLKAMRDGAQDYNRHLSARGNIFQKELFPPLSSAEMQRLGRAFVLQRFQATVGPLSDLQVRWLGNKDPDHGSNIKVMAPLFPRAAYIQIIRDGRDHLVSMWHHMQRHHPEYKPDRFADLNKMVAERAQKWSAYIRSVRQVATKAKLRYHELRYEDLQREPDAVLKEIFEFLEVNSDIKTTQSCFALADFKKFSGGRPKGIEDQSSFYRKGVTGDWRNYLTDEQSEEFCAATDGLMAEMGYDQIIVPPN